MPKKPKTFTIKELESEEKKWIKNGWRGKKNKLGTKFVPFIDYLKKKYSSFK